MSVSSPSFPPVQKRLGQNFLIDLNIVRKILTLADIKPEETVLEIGPGRGVLTEALAKVSRQVVAVEVDPLLHRLLQERRERWPNVELICADALEYPFDSLPRGTVVVANLPYYVSTPLLFKLLERRTLFPRLILMLQEEVVDRLVAEPGSSDYGVLSVTAQYASFITKAFRVSANCFRPRPDVGSAVALFETKQKTGLAGREEERFAVLVKAAFAHRRKTMVNSLRDEGLDQSFILEMLRRLGLPPTVRAEALPLTVFVEMARLDTART